MNGPTEFPVRVSRHVCANGETLEWRLSVGASTLVTIWRGPGTSLEKATRELLTELLRESSDD